MNLIIVGVRLLIGAIVVAILAVAALPLLALRDLARGGTGFGLCQDVTGPCGNSYFAGFELIVGLALVLAALLGAVAVLMRLLRRLTTSQTLDAAGVPRGYRQTGSLWRS